MYDKHCAAFVGAAAWSVHHILRKILTSLKIENWFVVGIFDDRVQVKVMIDVHT